MLLRNKNNDNDRFEEKWGDVGVMVGDRVEKDDDLKRKGEEDDQKKYGKGRCG